MFHTRKPQVGTDGIDFAELDLPKREYALRFEPGTPVAVVRHTIQRFNERLAARCRGKGAILHRCDLDPLSNGWVVESYHLYCDETMYQDFLARGEAIVVDDAVELASTSGMAPVAMPG